jgi:hypothetical protein
LPLGFIDKPFRPIEVAAPWLHCASVGSMSISRHTGAALRRDLLLILPVAAAMISLIPLVLAIPRMRLLGDDYILAAYATTLGIGPSVQLWSMFFASPVFSTWLFVNGWFLANLAPVLAYVPAVTLMFSCVACAGFVILKLMDVGGHPWAYLLSSIPITLALWVLAFGNLGGEHDRVTLVAQLNWASAGYRSLLALVYFLALAGLLMVRPRTAGLPAILVLLLGALVSLTSLNPMPDLISYVLSTLIVIALVARSRNDPFRFRRIKLLTIFALGQVLGLVYLLASPGMRGRRTWLPFAGYEPEPLAAIGNQVPAFLREALNPSLAIIILTVAALTVALGAASGNPHQLSSTRAFQLNSLLAGMGALFVLLTLSGSTNVLLGPAAVWHRWGLQTVAFILALLLGVHLGKLVANRFRMIAGVAVATVGLMTAAIPTLAALELVSLREIKWSSGDAPLEYIWDKGMWAACWDVLQDPNPRQHAGPFIPINPCSDLVELTNLD